MWPKRVGGYVVYTTVNIRICYHNKRSALTMQSRPTVRLLLQQRDPSTCLLNLGSVKRIFEE
jgi:hypothetical protein